VHTCWPFTRPHNPTGTQRKDKGFKKFFIIQLRNKKGKEDLLFIIFNYLGNEEKRREKQLFDEKSEKLC